MKDLLNNPGFIALVGTLFGGVGLKLVEKWLNSAKEKADAGTAIRDELRLEIQSLRDQLNKSEAEESRLEAELERWRNLYYDLKVEQIKNVSALTQALSKLKDLDSDTHE